MLIRCSHSFFFRPQAQTLTDEHIICPAICPIVNITGEDRRNNTLRSGMANRRKLRSGDGSMEDTTRGGNAADWKTGLGRG